MKNAKETPRQKVIHIFEQASDLAKKLAPQLSPDESNFIQESLNSRAIPTLKLLIKDHKKKD